MAAAAQRTTVESIVELFDAHAAGLHRYLARRAGAHAAESLVADTLRTAPPGSGRARLFGIATELLHTRCPPVEIGAASGTAEDRTPRPVDGLGALPVGELDVLLLAAWAGLGTSEIASALAVETDEVIGRSGRARRALRQETWSDAQLDGGLAELRSDVVSDAATIAALRERVLAEVQAGANGVAAGGVEPDGIEPDGNEPDGNEPDGNEPDGNEPDGNEPDGNEPDGNEPDGNEQAPAPGPPRSPVPRWVQVAAAAVVALVVGAAFLGGDDEAPVAGPPTPTAAPETPTNQHFTKLPDPTEPRSAAVAEIGLTATDPPVRPGQYVYRRSEQSTPVDAGYSGYIEELWIPSDPADEWLRRQPEVSEIDGAEIVPGAEQRAPFGRFDGGQSYGLLRGSMTLADLPRDPRLLHQELSRAIGLTLEPHLDALQMVAGLLRYQAVPADLRTAVFGALSYVPYLQVISEDDGRTTVVRAQGAPFGRLVSIDMLVDTATAQISGERFVDGGTAYTTRISTGVADEIGVTPPR